MQIDYASLASYMGIAFVSFVAASYFIGHISTLSFENYERAFNRQIEIYKNQMQKVIDAQLANIHEKKKYQNDIENNFRMINQELNEMHDRLESLNGLCNTRKSLENEIIKLKNIIKRKEANR